VVAARAYTQEYLLAGCPEAKRPEDLREMRSALEEASMGIAEGRTWLEEGLLAPRALQDHASGTAQRMPRVAEIVGEAEIELETYGVGTLKAVLMFTARWAAVGRGSGTPTTRDERARSAVQKKSESNDGSARREQGTDEGRRRTRGNRGQAIGDGRCAIRGTARLVGYGHVG
jgi:hypothetical protein